MSENRRKSVISMIIIVIATALAYANILGNGFVWDDSAFISNWTQTRSLSNVGMLIKGQLPDGHQGVYRPIRSLFYVLSYKLWGTNPMGYHFQSIIVHLVATLLVYLISKELLGNEEAALLAGLVFGLHPVHTEAISYATTSFDVIGIVASLGSFYSYVRSRAKLSIGLGAMAFFANEVTLVMPMLIVGYELFLKKSKFGKVVIKTAAFWVLALVYLVIRTIILEGKFRGVVLIDWYYTFLTLTKSIWYYGKVMLWPVNLSAVPTLFGDVTSLDIRPDAIVNQSIWDLRTVVVLVLGFVYLLFIFNRKKSLSLVRFCMFWFGLSLLPVLLTLFTGTVLAEKYLYSASVGFSLGIGLVYIWLNGFDKSRLRLVLVGGLVVCGWYGGLTFLRNPDWRSSETLWSKTVNQSPRSAAAKHNLGFAYFEKGNFDMAEEQWIKAVEIFPGYSEVYNNLGLVYRQKQDWLKSARSFEKAIETNPWLAVNYFNYADLRASLNDLGGAAEVLRRGVGYNPKDKWLYYNLGVVLYGGGKNDEAMVALGRALEIDPGFVEAKKLFQEIKF